MRITPLLGLELEPNEIVFAPGLSLRRVSNREIEDWVNPRYGAYDLPISAEQILSVDGAVVFERERPSENSNDWEVGALHQTDDVISAIRLVTNAAVLTPFTDQTTDGFLRSSGGSRAYHEVGSHYVRRGTLRQTQSEPLKRLWQRLQDSPNRQRIDLALRRWSAGMGRARNEDKIIDYWTGLESLFAPSSRQIAETASKRIASLANANERGSLYERVKGSYGVRSALVHGYSESELQKKIRKGGLTLTGVEALTSAVLRSSLLRILDMDVAFNAASLTSDPDSTLRT